MPPKATAAVAPAPTPNPAPPTPSPPPEDVADRDAQDILIIQDLMDTLEQIPTEMTRVHADLNELGAVLYTTLQNLELKLNKLIEWIEDPQIMPEQRFQLLMEIAEEAARYKLGGDDKIRVAGGACDGIMTHQKHISNLLAESSLMDSAPPSPYTTALTLSQIPAPAMSRRQIARAANSPFGGRGYAPGERTGETPTKKKKSRVQQLGKEDDDASSVGGGRKVVKKKKTNRAASPTDSVASASFAGPKPSEPRTARQLAAAQNKARKAERDDSDSDSEPERERDRKPPRASGLGMAITPSTDSMLDKNGLGLDVGGAAGAGGGGASRDASASGAGAGAGTTTGAGAGSGAPSRSANATPTLTNAQPKRGRNGNGKRPNAEDDSDDDVKTGTGGGGGGLVKKGTTNVGNANVGGGAGGGAQGDGTMDTDGEQGGDGEGDGKLYCTCRQVSYGEMLGCDDDDCEIEWYHIACLGFSVPPDGNWICPACVERRKKNPKGKRTTKPKRR